MNVELLRKVGEDILNDSDGFDMARSSSCIAARVCKAVGIDANAITPLGFDGVFARAARELDLTYTQRLRLFCENWGDDMPLEIKRTSPGSKVATCPSSTLNAQAAVAHLIGPMIAEEMARRAKAEPVKAEMNMRERELVTA